MDYKTAHNLILEQGTALDTLRHPDAFLYRLQKGQPPIPGQVTAILLALKILFDTLKEEAKFDRELTLALYQLAMEGDRQFMLGRDRGVEWPPLLREDLNRVALAVKSIFSGHWQDVN
ncbi:MAG: Dethiobiotin synthetase [Microcoleaceae cyanobacterium]